MSNSIKNKRKNTKDKLCTKVSISQFLDALRNEVVVLQNEIQQDTKRQQEQYKIEKAEGQDKLGSVMAESFLLEAIFVSFFGGGVMAGMLCVLSKEEFKSYLNGASSLIGLGNKLQNKFILSVYPKGRRTMIAISKTLSSGGMRRNASCHFMSPREANKQLYMLENLEKELRVFSVKPKHTKKPII